MSDYFAIGGVSETLQALLQDRMEIPGFLSAVPVTISPPAYSSKDADPHKEEPRVNLFLYRATENGYLQNQEIPGRSSPGAFGNPPLSLNLHYLITAYGNVEIPTQSGPSMFDDRNAQYLIGSAMRVLHDIPIITEQLTTQRAPSGKTILHHSLRDQYEQVKLSLEPLTLEDITKVWTALTLRYRLSAAYVVNVVQIESRRRRSFPRPVGQPLSPTVPPLPNDPPSAGPMIYSLTIQPPTISELRVRRAGVAAEQTVPYARIGDTLVLRGTSLAGPVTSIGIGDVIVPASFVSGDRVEAQIPDATIAGSGPIPAEQQLQPGVRTAKVIVRNPLVPQSTISSNLAAFMLVPAVNPALVTYNAGPPRTLTIQGTRLAAPVPGGQTMIGRSTVDYTAYVSTTATRLVVPIPDALPARNVPILISGPLADPIVLGGGPQKLTLQIGPASRVITGNLPTNVARADIAGILGGLIRDAPPAPPVTPVDPRFVNARVDLWNNQLIIVPGGLADPITVTAPAGTTFAGDLGLTAAQPVGATSVALSGILDSPPVLSSANPRITVTVGAQPPVTITVPKPTSLAGLAASLQGAINAVGGGAAYTGMIVAVCGTRLLFIPGAAGTMLFSAPVGDAATVGELQLHAKFAVRVRVNDAESFDPALVELPQ